MKCGISYKYESNIEFRSYIHAKYIGENDFNEAVFFPINETGSIKSIAINRPKNELNKSIFSNDLPMEASVLKNSGNTEDVKVVGFLPWKSKYEVHMYVLPFSNKKSELMIQGSVSENHIIFDEKDRKLKLDNSYVKVKPESKDGCWEINVSNSLSSLKYDKFEKDYFSKESIIGEIDTQYVRFYFKNKNPILNIEEIFSESVLWE